MRSCFAAPENEPASTTRMKASMAAKRSIPPFLRSAEAALASTYLDARARQNSANKASWLE
jgi:hypothetical protein